MIFGKDKKEVEVLVGFSIKLSPYDPPATYYEGKGWKCEDKLDLMRLTYANPPDENDAGYLVKSDAELMYHTTLKNYPDLIELEMVREKRKVYMGIV